MHSILNRRFIFFLFYLLGFFLKIVWDNDWFMPTRFSLHVLDEIYWNRWYPFKAMLLCCQSGQVVWRYFLTFHRNYVLCHFCFHPVFWLVNFWTERKQCHLISEYEGMLIKKEKGKLSWRVSLFSSASSRLAASPANSKVRIDPHLFSFLREISFPFMCIFSYKFLSV